MSRRLSAGGAFSASSAFGIEGWAPGLTQAGEQPSRRRTTRLVRNVHTEETVIVFRRRETADKHDRMAQKKAHEVDAWLKRPDPDIRMVLVYGPDRGLVSERARNFIRQTGLDASDPFSSVRLDAAEMESSPGRLTDEAMTVPMFADRRLVWVQGASNQKQLSEEVAALAGVPPAGTVIVIEAGDLKKGAALRSAVENARGAMALPCYPDEGRSIETIIDEVLSAAGLAIGMAVDLRARFSQPQFRHWRVCRPP